MKLIKPAEISAKIMTLIDEAENELIIVSPYNKISGWTKLINKINRAKERGVAITWYSRKNDVKKENSEEVINNLRIALVLINDLHAKIYMNEASAIFSSMNLSKVSDEKSIDLGYITENKIEYDELYNSFLKHIKSQASSTNNIDQNKKIPIKQIPSETKFKKIDTDEYYIKVIHEYILNNYGNFKFKYLKEELLEYYDFYKPGYKIQFFPYSQAFRIHLNVPGLLNMKSIEKKAYKNSEYKKLYKKSELEFIAERNQCFVKYYFEIYDQKLKDWGINMLNEFLKNLDIVINLTFN